MNLNKIKRVCGALFLVLFIGFATHSWAVDRGTLESDAGIYSAPNATSQVLGKYKKGMSFPIMTPEKNGWYEIQFKTPFKGFNKGYIRKESVKVSGGTSTPSASVQRRVRSSSSSSSSKSSSKRYSFGAYGGLYTVNLATAMTTVGETATSGSHLGFSAELGWPLSDAFTLVIGANYMTLSMPTIRTGQTQSLFANGFGAHVLAAYTVMKSGGFSITPSIGGGGSLMTAGNVNGTPATQISTTGIFTPQFLGRLDLELMLGESLAFRANAGYRMFTLSAVPVLLTNGTTQTSIDFPLGGLFFGGGLLLYF